MTALGGTTGGSRPAAAGDRPAPGAGILRVLPAGDAPATSPAPDLPREQLLRMMEGLLRGRILDEKMLLLQRQGRIGFYGQALGQEAAVVGSIEALRPSDWVFPALREGGALLARGFPLARYIAQLMGNALDVAKGRQMPCHLSSAAHRFVSLSSCIGTQIAQAAGVAQAARIRRDDTVVLVYFGDGATSEPDFHVGMNFAGVWRAPCVFFCQNNQFAISVPFERQTASEGVAIKARAYGMPGIRVDGNDVLAVHEATRRAAERARSGGGPTLIEAVTYRRGGHSSSDDPTRYRDPAAVPTWLAVDPIDRFRDHLRRRGILDAAAEEQLAARIRGAIETAITEAEAAPPPDPSTLFDDVHSKLTPALARDRQALLDETTTGRREGEFPL